VDFQRVNRGRAHSYTLDGETLPGVTTILNNAIGKPALVGWASNVTAEAAVDRWAELETMPPSRRLATLKAVRFETSGGAALNGTQIHAHAERLVAGEPVEVPPAQRAAVQALARLMDAWHMEPVLSERPVLHPGHKWAGTFDLTCGIRGTLWLIDWKTGKSIYPETALQLAAYAHAAYVQHEDGRLMEWVPPERAAAVHITADSAELLPIDWAITEEAYTVFRYAAQVSAWSDRVSAAADRGTPWPIGAALDPSAVVSVP